MQALWACMLPELSVDAGGHDTVDMEGAHGVADVSGMQHCLHQQHSVFLLLHQERACSAHSNNKNIDNDNDNVNNNDDNNINNHNDCYAFQLMMS